MKKFRYPTENERKIKSLKDKITYRKELMLAAHSKYILKVNKGDLIYVAYRQNDPLIPEIPTLYRCEATEDYDDGNYHTWCAGTSFKVNDELTLKIRGYSNSRVIMFKSYEDCRDYINTQIDFNVAKLELKKFRKSIEVDNIAKEQNNWLNSKVW